jgi:S-methylmethionine-dependent homocysteine/selenocysteine methylase
MDIQILDGGMGGEIQKRMTKAHHGLWSATALLEQPELVVDLHREYIEAGANIITTNTYSTIPSYLAKQHLEHRYLELAALAGGLANKARKASGRDVLIVGSIPPLSESYRADLVLPAEESLPIYMELVRALAPHVDLFICETMSSIQEALNASTQALAYGMGKPVYVSWTLNEEPGTGLRSNESVPAAYAAFSEIPVTGFMFNCTSPEAIENGIDTLRALTDKPIGCYPNRIDQVPKGWTLDNDKQTGRRTDIDEAYFAAMAQQYVAAGATIIGGCCGIGPTYIKALRDSINAS